MTDHDYYDALPARLRRLGVDPDRRCPRCGERHPDGDDRCETSEQDAAED